MCTVIFPRVNIRFKSYRLVETFTDLSIRKLHSLPTKIHIYVHICTYIYIKGPSKKRNRKEYYYYFSKSGIIARQRVGSNGSPIFSRGKFLPAIDSKRYAP